MRATWMMGLVLIGACASHQVHTSTAPDAQAAGMVNVGAFVADLDVQMRYAGSDNFVGAVVAGYEANTCYLLRPAAEALSRVQAELRAQGLRLRVYDCYRPVRAVRQFVAWAHDLSDQRTKPAHYPDLDKSQLLGGYIAESSGHSRGATVDLTLLGCQLTPACAPLDMGTQFDFFGTRAHTNSPEMTAQQRANRQRLRTAMARHGFVNYPLEWWHYTFRPEPTPRIAYDFRVR